MVRRVHHHHGTSGCIGPCDCPNPTDDEPNWRRTDRPPPTGYRDEHEVFHPGPGMGYAEHIAGCEACMLSLARAVERGDGWARGYRVAVPTFLPGPGEGAPSEQDERHPILRLRPQHIGPSAVAVGMVSYAIAALTPWWLTLPIGLALLALLVVAGRRDWLAVDRTPPARLLRR